MAHLPGQSVSVQDDEWGTKCDDHPEVDATHRICTESDSFGSEYANLCGVCWDQRQAAIEARSEDPDQWETCKCGNREPSLISYRDYEEGMHGPVYEHCSKCHEKMNARIAKELEDDRDYPYPDYYNADDFIDMHEFDEPEACYEGMDEEGLQALAGYLKSEYNLPFVIKKTTSKETGKEELSIILEVADGRAFKRINKRFDSFKYIDLDNNLISVNSLKEAMCGTADDIEVTILNRRISDRKIEGSKRTPALSMGELIQLARDEKRVKRKVAKEFITPVYAIEIILAKVYW